MNKAILIGNVGKDVEAKTAPDGGVFYVTVIATEVGYGKNKKTLWVDLLFADRFKNVIDLITKGSKIYVEGENKIKAYINKNGEAVGTQSVNVSSIRLLGEKPKEEEQEVKGEKYGF